MKAVLWYASRWGYEIRVVDMDTGEELDHYQAGNHKLDSGQQAARGSRWAMSLRDIVKDARETAQDMADEWGVPHENILLDEECEEDTTEVDGFVESLRNEWCLDDAGIEATLDEMGLVALYRCNNPLHRGLFARNRNDPSKLTCGCSVESGELVAYE